MHTPLIGSAGWLANQPTAWVRIPSWVSIFQRALQVRLVLVIGRIPEPSGRGSVKPWMPCLAGRLPVAMEVHSIGESIGWRVARLPQTPCSIKRLRLGISPLANKGRMIFQSAASQPISNTFSVSLWAMQAPR